MVKLTKKMILMRILCCTLVIGVFAGVAWHYWKTIFSVM